ncbi:MAG TPA: TetR/AcrR family transcriptional regulator, partial [Paracoccaceae bacterium]|nr:TetR/AcrR family transcriptional regulator [Paracoccaceae bacterium]
MDGSKQSERKSYHHGNLKEALVTATLGLITERGPTGFTLAEAARQAGVSPAAPYRHFKGREELIEEVARQGYIIFAEKLEEAYAKGKPNPLAAIEAVGRAYLAFATSNPGHYIAMFESGLSINSNADLSIVANRAMSVLTQAAERLFLHLPEKKRPPASMVSHHIWALSHGVVELFARGEPGGRAPFSAEQLLESGIGI